MNSKQELDQLIYQAQCYGSVEPIEYMVPYPNLGSLVEGQNIKLADQIWYAPNRLSYAELSRRVRRTVNWLLEAGITNQDRVLLLNCPSPEAEILSYAIWTIGAVLLLLGDGDIQGAVEATDPKLVIGQLDEEVNGVKSVITGKETTQYPKLAEAYSESISHRRQARLDEDAAIFWNEGKGIRLSHYNLLVNTNGVRIVLELDNFSKLRINLPSDSTAWIVLQALLPVYTGIVFSPNKGDISIGYPRQFEKLDFLVNFRWWKPLEQGISELLVVPEASAIIQVDDDIIPLLEVDRRIAGHLCLSGHSVMQGYLDDDFNNQVFIDGWLKLPTPA